MNLWVTVRVEFLPVQFIVLVAVGSHEGLSVWSQPGQLLFSGCPHNVCDGVQLLVLEELFFSVDGHLGLKHLIECEPVEVVSLYWWIMLLWRHGEARCSAKHMVYLVLAVSVDLKS